jgi:hypothetical protein
MVCKYLIHVLVVLDFFIYTRGWAYTQLNHNIITFSIEKVYGNDDS